MGEKRNMEEEYGSYERNMGEERNMEEEYGRGIWKRRGI